MSGYYMSRGYGESEEEYLRRIEAEERAANGWHCSADFAWLISSPYSDHRRPDETQEEYAMRKTDELYKAQGGRCDPYHQFSRRTERDDTIEPGVLYRHLEDDDD